MKIASTAVVVASAALFASACGSSSSNHTNTSTSSAQSAVSQAFKYAACMRDHGVNIPDPQVSGNGSDQKIAIRVVGPSNPRFKTALAACHSIMPGPSKADLAAQAAQRRARIQDMLSFARCMRGRGVNDFPDPTTQGQLTLQMITGAGVDLHSPQVAATARACIPASHGLLTAAAVAQATGSGG